MKVNMMDREQKAAMLAYLVKSMPLHAVTTITATMLEDRNDLRAIELQEFQRRINNLVWPLVDIDHEKVEHLVRDIPR